MRNFLMALVCCFIPLSVYAAEQPNVVLILVDDMGWNDLSCTGSTYYETPNIDLLAQNGTRFTQAYAACAVCSPTRAAVLTGRYPARVGITDWIRPPFNRDDTSPDRMMNQPPYITWEDRPIETPANVRQLSREEITLAEIFKDAGYATCYIGKWHLGEDGFYPDVQGFDYNIGGCSFGQPPSYFDPYFSPRCGHIPTLPPRKEGEYLTDREGDEAQQFIQQHKEEPFFLCYAPYAVHTPLQAKKEVTKKYKDKPGDAQGNPAYAAMVESVDEAVGKIMQTLKDEGLDKNTLVIFTSDNGGLLSSTDNSPLRSGKGYPWEGGIRVPAIAYWSGVVPENKISDTPFISVDLLPTICAAVKLDTPEKVALDGENFWPHIVEGAEVKRDALFWHFPHYRYDEVTPYSMVRSGDWKLIRYYDAQPDELYNLKEDIGEEKNLAEALPDKVKELADMLGNHLQEVGAKMPRKKAA